jgi:hypothetical protein
VLLNGMTQQRVTKQEPIALHSADSDAATLYGQLPETGTNGELNRSSSGAADGDVHEMGADEATVSPGSIARQQHRHDHNPAASDYDASQDQHLRGIHDSEVFADEAATMARQLRQNRDSALYDDVSEPEQLSAAGDGDEDEQIRGVDGGDLDVDEAGLTG